MSNKPSNKPLRQRRHARQRMLHFLMHSSIWSGNMCTRLEKSWANNLWFSPGSSCRAQKPIASWAGNFFLPCKTPSASSSTTNIQPCGRGQTVIQTVPLTSKAFPRAVGQGPTKKVVVIAVMRVGCIRNRIKVTPCNMSTFERCTSWSIRLPMYRLLQCYSACQSLRAARRESKFKKAEEKNTSANARQSRMQASLQLCREPRLPGS